MLLEREPATLRVTVTDDGVGGARITPDRAWPVCATGSRHSTRRLSIESEAGRGTNDLRRLPMRVVIADDAPLIREGVARLLTENGVEVVDQVGDADALLRSVRDLRPDVALVDIRMPPTHTNEGLRAARESVRATRTPPSSSSPNTSSLTTRSNSSKRSPKESATC